MVYAVYAVVLPAAAFARGTPLAGYPLHEWLLFITMAVGPGLFGHTVTNWALALLGEVPIPVTVAGGAVVLAGIVLTARERERASV